MENRKKNRSQPDRPELLSSAMSGARLTSVQFVLDYLILGFDERGALTTLVWPEIHQGGMATKFGMSGYRDRLCELIEELVKAVEVTQDETIRITFQSDVILQIPLKERTAPGEKAIFNAPKLHRLAVW
jgi:hypothetical protein